MLAPIAYVSMFSGFHAYDDEGYNLANLSDYLAGHPLLTPNALGYGPFFYEIFGGLFKVLGLAPDNDTGRMVTAVIWLIGSVAGGLVALRLSRNLWLGLTAELVTFGILIALANEPMSPYGLTALLLLGLAAAASFRSARPRATAALIGAIVSSLFLVKINIGGFAAAAVVLAWSAGLPQRWRRPLLALMVAVVTALPFLLTLPLLTRGWVFVFASVVALSAASVGVAILAAGPRELPQPSGRWIAAGGAVIVVACLGVALAGGTRATDIWNGLVVQPLRIPGLLTQPVTVGAGHALWAAGSFVVALALTVRNRIVTVPATAAGLMRVGAGFFTFLSLLLVPNTNFLLALPLAWLATQAPDHAGADPVGSYARVLLPTLAVVESLQAYPFAGSQLSLAAFCLVPVGAIALGDGIRQLHSAGAADRVTVKALGWVAPAALAINIAVFLLFALTAAAEFGRDTPVGLPGAESVRLPAQSATQLRLLVAAVDRDCSSLVTFPGMNSFYIWTGEDPPPMRVEVWWLFLDNNTQQSIVEQVTGKPRLCVIKNQRVIDMWSGGRAVSRSPLVDFIDRQFVHDSSYGDYELLVRAGP